MDFFSTVDLLSPSITLYYKSQPLHPSIFSGILSIIAYCTMGGFGLYYLVLFFQKENPTSYFYNRYVEDAGEFPLNSSSMFSFLQIYDTVSNVPVSVDFDLVRFIGIEETIDIYAANNDLTNYNHWLYGKCNNDSDTEGISHLINFEKFFDSACIRKYYDKNDKKYYDTTDKNFRWPVLLHGCSNPDRTFYGIIMEKCRNDTLRTNLEKKYCKSEEEINEYADSVSITFQLIDHYADVLNYKEPFTKYFYSVTNGIFSQTYTTNHLNFNPAVLKTRAGIISESITEKYGYFFDQNEKVTTDTEDTGIYVAFYFWMQNSMQYYERKYQLLQDALSNIGGISRIILVAASLINYIISRYTTLLDSEELFIFQNEKNSKETINNKNIVEKEIKRNIEKQNPPRKKNLYNNYQYQYQNNNIVSNANCISKENFNYSRLSKEGIEVYNNRNNLERNEKTNQKKYLVYNKNNYFSRNGYFYYERKELNKGGENTQRNSSLGEKRSNIKNDIHNNDKCIKEKDNINNINNNRNKSEFNYCKFLSYAICCYRNNKDMKYVENLRTKIISEENLVQGYFNLMEMNKLSEFLK